MRIGAPLNLPQLQQRPSLPKVPPVGQQSEEQQSKPQAVVAETGANEFSAEFFSTRAQSSSESSFYSTDRQLPLSGKAAMDTYLANASLAVNDSNAEWIGVDIYA